MDVGIQALSLNREHNALGSVFTALIDTGEYHHAHPFKWIIKLREKVFQMGFRSHY
ncbi:phage integrase [Candidatus Enterovibrio escicola]|uniref:phage integrase n=1 Tax=Candidatus Enterovibrio escicola TaxID=1927127 RepID=UPI003C1300CF